MTGSDGVWLYAITRDAVRAEQLEGLTGVAGEPVRAIEVGGLVAVVGSVSSSDFGEGALQRNLENLDWLAATARAHDGVVAAVLRYGPTIPLRLATVYHDDGRVRELLAARRDDFAAALQRVTGRTEWGVKAYGDREAMSEPVAAQQPAQGAAGKGTAYLLRRRAQLAAQENIERRAAGYADEIHATLLRCAVDGRRQPVTDPVLTGKRAWMFFNGTYLVEDAERDEFAATVKTLETEHEGVTLELSGPWPPYSFAGIEQEAP